MNNKLILHTGAKAVEREQVIAVRTPSATDTWHPVPHKNLLELLDTCASNAGLEIESEKHGLYQDGARYFGVFTLKSSRSDFQTVIGLRNSHDKVFPAAICAGSRVFVCDNLAFSAEIRLGRRHTKNVIRDLPSVFSRAFGRLADVFSFQERRFDAYRETELTEQEGAHHLMRLGDLDIIPKTKVLDSFREWKTPSHVENSERNGWGLFNAVTENLKGNMLALPNRTTALHGYLDGVCKVADEVVLPG